MRSHNEKLKELPEHWRMLYEERAAIMQFDGGLSRSEAEQEAWKWIMVEREKRLMVL